MSWLRKAKETYYHVTQKDFDQIDTEIGELGTHFGSPEQIESLVQTQPVRHLDPYARDKMLENFEGMRVYPGKLKLKNPLRLIDSGNFFARDRAYDLVDLGILTMEEAEMVQTLAPKDQNAYVQSAIMNAGYDGIVYLNRREGCGERSPWGLTIEDEKGQDWLYEYATDEEFKKAFPQAHDSYIVFEPEQIEHKFGTKIAGKLDGLFTDMRQVKFFQQLQQRGYRFDLGQMVAMDPQGQVHQFGNVEELKAYISELQGLSNRSPSVPASDDYNEGMQQGRNWLNKYPPTDPSWIRQWGHDTTMIREDLEMEIGGQMSYVCPHEPECTEGHCKGLQIAHPELHESFKASQDKQEWQRGFIQGAQDAADALLTKLDRADAARPAGSGCACEDAGKDDCYDCGECPDC